MEIKEFIIKFMNEFLDGDFEISTLSNFMVTLSMDA